MIKIASFYDELEKLSAPGNAMFAPVGSKPKSTSSSSSTNIINYEKPKSRPVPPNAYFAPVSSSGNARTSSPSERGPVFRRVENKPKETLQAPTQPTPTKPKTSISDRASEESANKKPKAPVSDSAPRISYTTATPEGKKYIQDMLAKYRQNFGSRRKTLSNLYATPYGSFINYR